MVLEGRVALVTGVSRQRGIGIAIARHLGQLGAQLFLHGFTPYDRSQPWRAVRMITDKDIYVAVGGYRSVHHLFRSVGIEEVCLQIRHGDPILL